MIRLISLLSLVPWLLLATPVAAHSAPALKPAAHVSSAVVTIGDLVSNAGAAANVAIFRSPDLGETGSVPAEDIVAAAAARGLKGIDTGGIRSVSVTRDSRTVTLEELQGPLATALAARTDADPRSLDVALGGKAGAIHLPVEADGALQIRDAVWNRGAGTFDAVLTVRRLDGREERRVVRGTAVETATVVTLARDVARGTVLAEGDLQLRRVAKGVLHGEALTDIALAAGLETHRSLNAGDALRASDLTEPTLVKRSSAVTVVLKSGGLMLTASGQALRDGKRGETIPVMNAQSRRVLQAVVTNLNEVSINPPRPIVSAAK